MRRYRKKYENDRISFFVSVFALILVFILTALCPVDTFIVSEMKFSNGTFKEWASELEFRESVERSVQIAYIVLYSFICFTVFCVLPFTYFLYDSRDDDNESRGSSICSALISTLIVLIIPTLIIIISLFFNIKNTHPSNSTLTLTDTVDSLLSDGANKIISNLVCVLGALGMLNLVIYTGFGLSTWPIGLIRGLKDVKSEFDEVSRRQMTNTAAINSLKSKRAYLGRLSEEDDALLKRLENKERDDQLKETIMRNHLTSWTYKFKFVIRPFQIVFGVVFLLISCLIIVSLLINNIDSLLHSSLKNDYFLKKKTIFNPIDFILTEANRVYPLDFIIYLLFSWYLIFCTLSGVRNLGIGIFFYKLSKFKPGQTTPQGLLLGCSVLMMSMMVINLLMFAIAPDYSSFGNQVFADPSNNYNLTQCNLDADKSNFINNLLSNNNNNVLIYCFFFVFSEDCTVTRSTFIIDKYFYHSLPYVGIGFFISTWFVVLFFVLAMIYSICRQSRKGTLNEFDSLEFEDESQ